MRRLCLCLLVCLFACTQLLAEEAYRSRSRTRTTVTSTPPTARISSCPAGCSCTSVGGVPCPKQAVAAPAAQVATAKPAVAAEAPKGSAAPVCQDGSCATGTTSVSSSSQERSYTRGGLFSRRSRSSGSCSSGSCGR